MKKTGLVFLVLMVLVSYAAKDSDAAQWCFQLGEGSEMYIRLSVVKPDPNYPIWSLNGMWYDAARNYCIPLDGTMVKNADGTQRILGLEGVQASANVQYFMGMEIDAVTKNGTLSIYFVSDDIINVFSINKVKCNTAPAPYE